jgi:hypothetical protein
MALLPASDFLAYVNSAFFWQNFWPNFFADFFATLIVGIGITWLISWLAARRRKIKVRVVATVQRSPGSLALDFVLTNTGNVDFREKELYWHLWVAKRLEPAPHTHTEEVSIGEPYIRFSALLKHPAFSPINTALITIAVKNEPVGDRELLYFLSTAYGAFPHDLKTDSRGVLMSDQLGVVEIANSNSPKK